MLTAGLDYTKYVFSMTWIRVCPCLSVYYNIFPRSGAWHL